MAEIENENEAQTSVNEEINNDSNLGESFQNESKSDNEESLETDITAELESLKEKCETLHNDYLRLYADFDNYKKRALKDKADLIKSAGENIFNNMLPLIDDFERALKAMENATEVSSVKEGVDLIYGKFLNFLSQNGVKPIETEAKEFDTDFHEAIAKIPAPSEDMKGKIIDCTQKGYMLNEKVIRYAKVVVGE
ncbi:MAG: nucleotide exchange factor GrpE [Paludibacteraceae bacterium]|nr:nucleotide exchange factor GrpE [Paludibacteraceae bacterium]